ncbi:nuclear speckle splicing regulatory protein 1-like [Centruroides vittatus]
MEIQKLLEEDPTIYEYDSIYDDMKSKNAEKREIIIKDRKPKYIGSLMKAAELRKKEYERRIERQIQKEREKEGNEFEDKEAFVTSSYKKKLLEKQEEEERERRQKELEGIVFILKPFKIHFIYIYSS